MELELWLGPQKDAILQTLESTMSLQFGRARQQLTNASLPPIQKEILRRLAHQMRKERLSQVRKLSSKRFSINQSGFAFNWQWKQNLIVAWYEARQYIEASWTKFPTILGYTPA
jgi:hypothetical protein